jgi:hypothetical protein
MSIACCEAVELDIVESRHCTVNFRKRRMHWGVLVAHKSQSSKHDTVFRHTNTTHTPLRSRKCERCIWAVLRRCLYHAAIRRPESAAQLDLNMPICPGHASWESIQRVVTWQQCGDPTEQAVAAKRAIDLRKLRRE